MLILSSQTMVRLLWVFVFTASLSFYGLCSEVTVHQEVQTFIVRVRTDLKPSSFSNVQLWYKYMLSSLHSTNSFSSQKHVIIHVYETVFHGFSARLTPHQADLLKERPEVVAVFPDRMRQIHTTRSPHFLGLDTPQANTTLMSPSDYGSDVIIGFLDTGIWPERQSFNDEGLGPIPSRWKGECEDGEQFNKTNCNKKLIGARYYTTGFKKRSSSRELKSPRDTAGHGTHTASTAAGSPSDNASLFGFASGVAVGMASKARIAMYKVCELEGCMESDILAGFDRAVVDGVDIVSLSLGAGSSLTYANDVVAVAAFGAMEKGVLVSASAGNEGFASTISNAAPWILTVGAGFIDRRFPADLLLEGGTAIVGSSVYAGKNLSETFFPLIYAGNASTSGSPECLTSTLDPELVRGKIVICDLGDSRRVAKGLAVSDAGGVGVVVANLPSSYIGLQAESYLLPGLAINESARQKVLDYVGSNPNPRAKMDFRGTQVPVKPAPVLAAFSSRGPNMISLNVIKPDVIAPGVDILAAWPDGVSPSRLDQDPRRTEFNILSGTSMSCPHVSGIAALLKGVHRDWSPAVIKSALMTTAYSNYEDGIPLLSEIDLKATDPWGIGSGHVDPDKAVDPGLVYNLTADDYLNFLCASNISAKDIMIITQREVNCTEEARKENPGNLNYPAISVVFKEIASLPTAKMEVEVTRTVTNVHEEASTYSMKVANPNHATVTVDPEALAFSEKLEKKSFVVRISADIVEMPLGQSVTSEFGQLSWSDGRHHVNSPIIVSWVKGI